MKRFEQFLWVLAIGGLLVGAFGLYDRLMHGHLMAAYGSYIPWGLWVGAYIYLIGVSAGAFLISALVYVFGIRKLEPIGKLALFTAIITLGIAMFSIFLDLGHPERAWRLVLRTNFYSVMGWMIWLYTAYLILLVVELWFALRGDFARWSARRDAQGFLARILGLGQRDLSPQALARDKQLLRVLGALGVPLAIAFHGGVGALFGVVGARAYWNTGLTPIMFLVGALLSGGALLTFVTYVFGPTHERAETVLFLGRITLGLLLLDLLLEWAEYSIGLYSAIPAEVASMKLVLFGPYWWAFWLIHVGLGALVPLGLLVGGRKSAPAVATAGLLIALTFFTVRLNIVIPGLAVPELEGLANAFTGPGLTFDYFPTLTEWLLQIWILAAGLLAFLIGYRLLPIVVERPAVETLEHTAAVSTAPAGE